MCIRDRIKAGKAKEISDMRDETDLSGLKLAIDLKRGVDPDKLMDKLYKLTPLEDAFACNFNVLILSLIHISSLSSNSTLPSAWFWPACSWVWPAAST